MMRLGKVPKQVAEYFLNLARADDKTLSPMQVLKLVYIAHGWNLGLNAQPLVNEDIEAWQYGPVIPSLYHKYKQYGSNPIQDFPAEIADDFNAKEKIIERRDLRYRHHHFLERIILATTHPFASGP